MSLYRFIPRVLSRPLPSIARPLTTITATSSPTPSTAPSTAIRPHHIVISLAGEDRVGIVRTVTSTLASQRANVEESKMAILGGDFAMIVYVSTETPSCADAIATSLKTLLPTFSISVRNTTPPDEAVKRNMWTLLLEGPDCPGIVAEVTNVLATHGANVHDMDTETTTAPFAGYPLFRMKGKIAVSDDELEKVGVALAAVEDKFGSSINLEQIPRLEDK
eukprot:GFKZ01015443.1.p1 GENE.GFKZ01015443.1~~GFKZ01015443.1.p1  ORF type:complete len:220 (-),score=35.48 GFKZ01015443.1:30-689(-)